MDLLKVKKIGAIRINKLWKDLVKNWEKFVDEWKIVGKVKLEPYVEPEKTDMTTRPRLLHGVQTM